MQAKAPYSLMTKDGERRVHALCEGPQDAPFLSEDSFNTFHRKRTFSASSLGAAMGRKADIICKLEQLVTHGFYCQEILG